MNRILFLILAASIFYSCSSEEKPQAFEEHKDSTAVQIRPSLILGMSNMMAFIPTPQQEKKADWCTEQSYKLEEEDLSKSIYYQIKAITYHPTATRYIRLAKLYSQHDDYCKAGEVYEFIFKSYPDGNEEMLYELLYCSMKGNCRNSLYYINQIAYDKHIEIANLISKVEGDERLVQVTNTLAYSKQKRTLSGYYDCGDTISFAEYLVYFDPIKFPYVINDKNVGLSATEINGGMECDVDVDTFLVGHGNFENWTTYEMLTIVHRGSYGVTVLYEGDSSDYEDRKDLKNTFFKIVSYNPSGTILCDTTVAWRVGATERHCTISADLTVKMDDYERVFKRPYDQSDKENELLDVKQTATTSFKINSATGCFPVAP